MKSAFSKTFFPILLILLAALTVVGISFQLSVRNVLKGQIMDNMHDNAQTLCDLAQAYAIDGSIISNTTQMTSYLQSKQAGDVVKIKLYRVDGGLNNVEGNEIPKGEYIDLEATLAVLDEVQQ